MKAAVFHGPRRPLTVEDVPLPEVRAGEILVRVAACGVCHTDLHYLDHDVPTFRKPPLILGHEPAGLVERIGAGVLAVAEGDRVLLPAVLTCGTCELCRAGRENICLGMAMFGNHIDGAFAEYVRAPAKDAVRLPPELSLEEAAVIADAVSTPYHAVVNRARVRAGDTVAVFGCGGVGLNAVQLAVAVGATVIAVDLDAKKLALAREFGARDVIDAAAHPEPAREVKRLTGGGVDVAFEAVGSPRTLTAACDALRRGGKLCVIGYSEKPFELNAARLMFHELEVMGSLGCRPVDYPRVVRMVQSGRIRVGPLITGRFPLERINDALDALRAGEGIRNVVIPGRAGGEKAPPKT
ncbi:MAG: zinc-binding dehydrogenase [Planctomycetes bacterium]|nr:zinc-binding dehydrogenase [Planctomycetota bacterium]